MFGDMAWAGEDSTTQSEWELELMRMRYNEAPTTSTSAQPQAPEPMELSPDPFYLNPTPPPATTTSANTSLLSSVSQPTLTTSASCPSFTSFYGIDGDDLLRDIPDGEPLTGEPLLGNPNFMALGGGAASLGGMDGYDYVLQFQQQHQNGTLRQFPHQSSTGGMMVDHHMALLQQSRRPLHMSASFTSLSSMETEYRRRLASKRKKAVTERWNKAQRHKSFDSTTSTIGTAPSPTTSMEFSTFDSNNTFESTPETTFLGDTSSTPAPRRPTEGDMIGFSIDDFPTTFTSDASWPMPPPLSLSDADSFNAFAEQTSTVSTFQPPAQLNPSSEMDQLLLSDQERANVSSLLDAIRDFDSPSTPVMPSSEPKRTSPTLSGKPRPGSGQQRSSRSPHLRGIARTDSGRRKEPQMQPVVEPPTEEAAVPSVRERVQKILERTSSSVQLSSDETAYLKDAPQFATDKAAETAGSLWLLLHGSRCIETNCTVAGCDVMRRVVRHCRGCEAPLGKCRDPCNDAKAMLLHHGTCGKAAKKLNDNADNSPAECVLCSKVQEIERAHNASNVNARPPLSPQLKPQMSPTLLPMAMPMVPLPMPLASPLGGPVLIAPQPSFTSPTLKSTGSSSKHVNIQPNPLPTASNPMGLIGSFPQFGCSLALYLEQTAPAFRAEVKSRVEKRVTTAAGQDLIQHMQKKTRLRSLEDLRSEARAIVLGEMERELHLHMQAVNWANVAGSSTPTSAPSEGTSSSISPTGTSEPALPAYLLNVAAAGFAAFYAQQATLQAAMAAGVAAPFGLALSRQSSGGAPSSSASVSSSTTALPLAPRKSQPALEPSPASEPTKEAALSV